MFSANFRVNSKRFLEKIPKKNPTMWVRSFSSEVQTKSPDQMQIFHSPTSGEAPGHDSVQLVQITPITMVYGTYNYSYWAL